MYTQLEMMYAKYVMRREGEYGKIDINSVPSVFRKNVEEIVRDSISDKDILDELGLSHEE